MQKVIGDKNVINNNNKDAHLNLKTKGVNP